MPEIIYMAPYPLLNPNTLHYGASSKPGYFEAVDVKPFTSQRVHVPKN